jgi:hypothetical protein
MPMRIVALLLLLPPPAAITSIGVLINPDTSVTISWALPVDPSVVGVTIIRDRLDVFETNAVFTLTGAPVTYTDTTALVHASYRYWVYTRNSGGELSTGAFAEVFGAPPGGYYVGSSSSWWCYGAASGGASPLSFLLGAVALLVLLRRR